jgi:hypothetical protein
MKDPTRCFCAQRAIRYQLPISKEWHLNFGIEKPTPQIDNSIDADMETVKKFPEVGVNARWERSGVGHVQLSSLVRDIRMRSDVVGDDNVLGWGVNVGAGLDITKNDSVQALFVYGEGIGALGNDGFDNTDAFDDDGNLGPAALQRTAVDSPVADTWRPR